MPWIKRSLFFCTAALLSGVYMAYFAPDSIPLVLCIYLLLVFFVALFFTKRGAFLFFALLMFLMGAFRMQAALDVTRRPLHPFLNEYVTVTADLIKEPERKEGYAVLYAELTSVSFLGKTLPLQEKVRLTVGGKENIPAFGDSFEAICLFSLPKEADNWGDFDYQLYLKSQKIYFTGKVEAGTLHKTGQFSLGLTERLYQLNRHCFRLLERRMPQEAAAVLQAMALGDTSGFTDDFRDNLKVSGLSHVTAVSGMHVSTLVSMLYILFSVLGQNRYKFIWLTGGVIIFFMLFTGASPSVVRAAIMGIMTLLAYIFFRREDKLTSLGVAAAVIVMLNPPAALHTGFLTN